MGTGHLDVVVDILPLVLAMLPRTYEVIGSMESPHDGVARLKLRSEFLVGSGNHVTCEVRDVGGTRNVTILPV